MTSEASIAAFIELKETGELSERQAIIYEIVKDCPLITAPAITNALLKQRRPQESVASRLGELVELGYIKKVPPKIRNRETKRMCTRYAIVGWKE